MTPLDEAGDCTVLEREAYALRNGIQAIYGSLWPWQRRAYWREYQRQHDALARPQVIGPSCLNCQHPSTQHDDGGCLFPKWDKSGGTTCYCAGFREQAATSEVTERSPE